VCWERGRRGLGALRSGVHTEWGCGGMHMPDGSTMCVDTQ
jgi:hypothetical protein